jgi:hypothetical protein
MFSQRIKGFPVILAAASILTVPALSFAQLPIKLNTPGKASRVSKDKVCSPDYASSVKPISKWQASQALRTYGLREDSDREVVRLIPASLGGTNDIENIWPIQDSKEWGAAQKKALDDKLTQMVCAGSIELKAAQDAIKRDWVEAYKKHVTQ